MTDASIAALKQLATYVSVRGNTAYEVEWDTSNTIKIPFKPETGQPTYCPTHEQLFITNCIYCEGE